MAAVAILNFKNFSHVTVIVFNICCSVPNVIKSDDFSLRFNDFQNGGRPPSWISKICSCYHVAFVGMRFCFLMQNFAEIAQWLMSCGQKSDFQDGKLAILNFKNLNFWSQDCIGFNICRSVPNFIKIGRFFTEIWRFNNIHIGGRPPSWILKICGFCHVAFVGIPLCFLVQSFAEIRQSVDELWQKNGFSRRRPPPS